MLAILRRKIASEGSNASCTIGQSLRTLRPFASSATRRYTAGSNETLFLRRGSKYVQNFSCQILPGTAVTSKSMRLALIGTLRSLAAYFEKIQSFKGGLGHSLQLMVRCSYTPLGDPVDVVVPFMGESITDGTLAAFLKKPGDSVQIDEPIARVETDKVTIDVASPEAGVIQKFVAKEGDTVEPGTKIAVISKSGEGANVTPAAPSEGLNAVIETPKPSAPAEKEKNPSVETVVAKVKPETPSPAPYRASAIEPIHPPKEREIKVRMTRLRKTVAERLKRAQDTTNLMNLRSEYKDAFLEKHGVKLGFMSTFVKAAVSGLQEQPVINASIDGDDIIYRNYFDISVAVGSPKGLVVPVIRDAEKMNFADIEKEIHRLAKKARDGSLSIDDMAGGSFTISNGGVYGSLLSTPIINPPQSAILGMHSVVSRPMVVGGSVVPRPMMYVALTYDHRLIDGREAVLFLRRIKDVVEDPCRLLLDV
ncbi:hypothetical protein C5167_017575 [Papaver somniferum]|uniref:Dihydrolipoamide acetyltransferase component of pyruvate dehydrogenase complex n=1 Tax=Papaver somniferum TaxID=3469 RepID=A0A4Y7IN62_PAPSO|nr:hypothetical protein C5167_017575 [Papaver somniferum]